MFGIKLVTTQQLDLTRMPAPDTEPRVRSRCVPSRSLTDPDDPLPWHRGPTILQPVAVGAQEDGPRGLLS